MPHGCATSWSGRAMARTGLRMMPTSPSSPLKFRTAGFPRYGFKAGLSGRAFPRGVHVSRRLVGVHPSCPPLANRESPVCVGDVARMSTAMRAAFTALPQGPSLRSGFCCPSPSPLNRPHPSHSQAHRDFAFPAYTRCHRCAIAEATHEWFRAFTARSFSACRPLRPRGTRRRLVPTYVTDDAGLRPNRKSSAFPTLPPSASSGAFISGLHWFTFATACRVASLLDGSDRVSPAAETCTSGLSTRRSPFASPGITTVALGQSPLAGLSPAGTAASIAAPYPERQLVTQS